MKNDKKRGTVQELIEALNQALARGTAKPSDPVALVGCDCVGAWSGNVKVFGGNVLLMRGEQLGYLDEFGIKEDGSENDE